MEARDQRIGLYSFQLYLMSQYLQLNLSLKKCLHSVAQEPQGSFCLHFKAVGTYVYTDIPGFFKKWMLEIQTWVLMLTTQSSSSRFERISTIVEKALW